MLTVFWCSTPFIAVFVFWLIKKEQLIGPTRWWPCCCRKCVSSQPSVKKTWTAWDALSPWTWCGNAIQTKMEEIGYTFYKCVGNHSKHRCFDWVFLCEVFSMKFSVIERFLKGLHLVPKLISPRIDWLWGFLSEYDLFRRCHSKRD